MRTLIDTTVRVVIIALMAMVFCCVVWQVLSRYVVSSPSVLTEELARFGLVWIGALGMGYVTGQKRHLAIDLLSGKLPPSARRALLIFVELATLVFAVLVLTYGGGLLVRKVYMSGQTSPKMSSRSSESIAASASIPADKRMHTASMTRRSSRPCSAWVCMISKCANAS